MIKEANKNKKICCMIVIIGFLAFAPSWAVNQHSELNRLLSKSNSDQIMMALEPSFEMPTEKIREEIKLPVLWLLNNTFYLFLSTEKPDKKLQFQAFYGIPVSYAWGVTQHVETIHHYGNITGRGATSRDALVDLVKKLVENGLIDPGPLVGRLKKFHRAIDARSTPATVLN